MSVLPTAALTPLRAIRNKCLWCCNGSAHEVALCPAKACPSWSFRFGHKPTEEVIAEQRDTPLHPLEWRMTASEFQAARHSALKAIKRKCLDCSGASKAEVRNCAFVDCALHIFRRGTNPNRAHSPEERARRAAHLGNVKAADGLIKKSVSIAPHELNASRLPLPPPRRLRAQNRVRDGLFVRRWHCRRRPRRGSRSLRRSLLILT